MRVTQIMRASTTLWAGLIFSVGNALADAPTWRVQVDPSVLMTISSDSSVVPLVRRVQANLLSRGYAMESDSGRADRQLKVDAIVSKQSTAPVGFSFTPGSADPRAGALHPVPVVTFTCRTDDKIDSETAVSQQFAFASRPYSANKTPRFTDDMAVEAISTVCLSVLEQRQVPTLTPVAADAAWKPRIRVEVRDEASMATPTPLKVVEPQVPAHPESSPATTHSQRANDPSPAVAGTPTSKRNNPGGGPSETLEAAPAATSGSTAATGPGPTGTTTTGASGMLPGATAKGRKTVIIHNQGSPLELEFGYQRR